MQGGKVELVSQLPRKYCSARPEIPPSQKAYPLVFFSNPYPEQHSCLPPYFFQMLFPSNNFF